MFNCNDDIASYYRQHSADSKFKNEKIYSGFVNPEGPKSRANKSGIDIMFFFSFSYSYKICLDYDTLHIFPVWL